MPHIRFFHRHPFRMTHITIPRMAGICKNFLCKFSGEGGEKMRAVLLEFLTQCAARAGPSARAEDARRKSAAGGRRSGGRGEPPPPLDFLRNCRGFVKEIVRTSSENPIGIIKDCYYVKELIKYAASIYRSVTDYGLFQDRTGSGCRTTSTSSQWTFCLSARS